MIEHVVTKEKEQEKIGEKLVQKLFEDNSEGNLMSSVRNLNSFRKKLDSFIEVNTTCLPDGQREQEEDPDYAYKRVLRSVPLYESIFDKNYASVLKDL